MQGHIEEALMLFLLLEHPHDASHRLAGSFATAGERRVDRAEAFIRTHLREPLGLADIAQAVDVSIRSLTAAFRTRHDLSPMKYVEGVRLDAARTALRRSECGVTDIATDLGFSNAGRFAAAYRKRFGHAPSADRASRATHRTRCRRASGRSPSTTTEETS